MATFVSTISLLVISVACLLFLLFLAYCIYLGYVHWKYNHIPGPKRDSFFSGNLPWIRRERERSGKIMGELMAELHKVYGPVVLMWAFHNPFIFASDPELARKCLVTLNLPKNRRVYGHLAYPFGQRCVGDGLVTETDHKVWQKHRALLNPAFHRRYLMNLMNSFNSSCDLFLAKLDTMADGKTIVDMAEEFSRVTLDVIGKVAFNVDVDVIRDADSPFPSAVAEGLKGIQESIRSPFWRVAVSTFPFQRRVAKALRFIRNYAKQVIQDRQEAILHGDDTPNDILAHILCVAKEEPTVTLENLVDEFVTFFIAGQETTSNQLSFTLYEILKHSHVEDRIVEEIETVLGCRQFVEYKDLGNLQYLGQTLKEALRVHPPVGGTTRVTTKDENFAGHLIPAGTSINISWFILHRLPKAWAEPGKFDPDRFSPDAKSSVRSQEAMYYPFSIGPRTCIGQTFAQFEARVLMARLLQEFELTLLPGQNEIKHEERLTLRPKGGVLCTLKRRSDNKG